MMVEQDTDLRVQQNVIRSYLSATFSFFRIVVFYFTLGPWDISSLFLCNLGVGYVLSVLKWFLNQIR